LRLLGGAPGWFVAGIRPRHRWWLAILVAGGVGSRWFRHPPHWAYPSLIRLYAASFALPIPRTVRRWALRTVRRTVVLGCAAVIPAGDGAGYLFARHRYPHGGRGEVWALPSGAVRREPLVEALAREVEEELGLTVAVERLLAVDASLWDEVTFYFRCRIAGGQIRLSAEVAEARYLAPDPGDPTVDQTQLAVLRRLGAERSPDSAGPILLP
jgi:8-oxo-dGTP pyrophosphatase MutT (NUDIX family)